MSVFEALFAIGPNNNVFCSKFRNIIVITIITVNGCCPRILNIIAFAEFQVGGSEYFYRPIHEY
jgi:hypothetical protein